MFYIGDFSVTKREILISIAIIAILLVIGFMIAGAIENSMMLKHQEYNLALQIDNNKDMFEYGMRTNVGNAYVYGELKCLDPVTYDEIGGEYSYIKKVKERYTQHTRVVTYTVTVNGKPQTRTRTETYWTWDAIDSWSKQATKISFVDVEFNYGQIKFPGAAHVKTLKESSTIRYVYYGAPVSTSGTLYSNLESNTINQSSFYTNWDIETTHKHHTSGAGLVIFWIGWSLFIIGSVVAFVLIDNHWLEDRWRYKK